MHIQSLKLPMVLAATILLARPLCALAQAIPDISGTAEEAWIATLEDAEKNSNLISGGVFNVSDNKFSWPCKVDIKILSKYARLEKPTNSMHSEVNALNILGLLSATNGAKDWTLKDITYVPLTGGCNNGKLAGKLSFIARYTTAYKTPDVFSTYKIEKYVELTVEDGRPSSPIFEFSRLVSSKSKLSDPIAQSMLARAPSAQPLYAFALSERDTEMILMPTFRNAKRHFSLTRRISQGTFREINLFEEGATTSTYKDGAPVGDTKIYRKTPEGVYIEM